MAIRPARQQPRPLSVLGSLLGVRLASMGSSFSPNDLGFVSGVTLDSRAVAAGDLYVALPGSRVHGAAFCADAVAAGAVAILTDPDGKARAAATGVPVFVLADPRGKLGEIACWVYGNPSGRMTLIGVTGTSGKTTSTYLLESGLRQAGHRTGLIGGVESRIGSERLASSLTTPEAPDLQALFAVMAERGVTAAAMEVSSHSLALGRVAGTSFDVAVFTNLSQDHLDFHADMEDYFRVKASLFMPPLIGVVNIDDKYGRRLRPRPSCRSRRSRLPARPRRTGGPPTSGPARTAAPSASSGRAGSTPTCRWGWPAGSTWPTRSARWSRWSRPASGWRTRWPGSRPARASRAGWSGCPRPGSTSRRSSTTRTSPARSRPCCARCGRSPAAA